MKLSVIIPSWKDPLLINTIDSLLQTSELGEQLEIIAVFDGYWPAFELRQDPRVRYVHLGKNRGMREAINAGVDVAKGKFIMRTDEHCVFDQGFDRKMIETCHNNWIMTARRYFLDPVKWDIMDLRPVDYEKLKIRDLGNDSFKFEGVVWHSRTKERKHKMVDETMAMQGSCWVMRKRWWNEVIKKLNTRGYGTMYQDSHEMQFKTWKAGGKLMLNKNTWFAHKHSSFRRTHNNGTPENPAKNEEGYAYALSQWRDYYETEVRPLWGI
jgi:glycosyltransferase involved in cell wall biosynthesis